MYQRTVLPNGVRIITEYLPFLRSVTLGAWFEVGSRHEQPSEWGLSHFIEHMMFKGTEKYSARDIAEIMDQRGGYLNAFTSKEQTCYYFKVLDEHYETACELLQQMLLRSLFSPVDVAKERNVVLEELRMYEDTPEELVHDLFSETLWPTDPLGRNIIGSTSSISGFTSEMIRDYMARHYTADRLVIASAGNISHDKVVESFAKAFDSLPGGLRPVLDKAVTRSGQGLFQDKDIEQVHLCVGGPAPCRHDERRYALSLLDTMIGGGVSSLLFQELREERGLVYNSYSFTSLYDDVGAYGVYAGFNPQQWAQVWDVLRDVLDGIPQLITPEMLERAKSQMKGSLVLSMESTSNRMTRLVKGEMDEGGIVTPEETMKRLEKVTYEEVMKLASVVYNPQDWSWVGLGPRHLIKEDSLCQEIC
ncbi:MAG TPA: insulinase family protein [Firmicutes bacterium]|jgi:predicted Zn-dependent peptidase|nr:insulinase family protein [Bacillota bacterium]